MDNSVVQCDAVVIKLLSDPKGLDDLGRDMVKTICEVGGKVMNVYVQHPVDNSMITVGYKFTLYLKSNKP